MTPKERYKKLKEHLAEENPLLVEVIDKYRELDIVARNIGFLDKNETYTASISWWPLIAILGTFSAGKSSFINEYLGKKVQNTGNQAVDDKFTVICYSKNEEITTLPGVALDADPRFPFYNISTQIEKLDPNDKNINRYLQLKAVKSDKIKGKILIDSPGFDADVQRDAILRITSHIIDLSDLVLVFFDARHPEPGAMRDTLNHLVQTAITHTDADKVLYILNQIDTCAKEDNLEEIIGAWQRALSQKGIVSGKFYAIYNESLAHIEDPELAQRLKKKKDKDLSAITEKMEKVVIDRAYRIAKNIETRAKEIIEQIEPLKEKLSTFKITMLVVDIVLVVIVGGISYYLANIIDFSYSNYFFIFLFFLIFLAIHFKLKSAISSYMSKKIENSTIKKAFIKHTRWVKPYLLAGSFLNRKKIEEKLSSLINASKHFIQKLNDQYINLKKEEHITEA
ncbi:hypothetical protein NitYY0826_C1125 [Nitratiruptor sp. YY08-26]|uniref:dynamin family protein n=1 Tax=unclassified Nitratiruptor TaxID=2624044 RepID=UPI001915178D|nr:MULTISPECIES: dynamin family protein [unclassified Nitratiruptor]BCD62249.1 hypothetical protein NitYY0813_C1123 [Nitratiruptor sp. YY08-13]BCD66185.1 hypothetical protein NitYY0826_C1125 [Nitratiruptor sp. YY08-26]